MARRKGFAWSALAVMLAVTWAGAQAESHVRIIRLSYMDGAVQMDRATGQGLERAILNTPITEGSRLVTGRAGLAEFEFENNSTVRLGENSEVRFTRLVVSDAGAKVNDVEVVKGTVYFDTKGNKDDVYRATAGGSAFQILKDTQVRLSDDTGKTEAAVLKGDADLLNQPQQVKIKKKETLTLDAGAPAGYQVAKGVDAGPLDRWNNERSSYQTAYSYNAWSTGPKINGYGYSDLSYYGAWYSIPGVGMAWQPYGIGDWVGWNPYMAGAWAFYPGMGYAWASAYPWGWLPYHYGSWSYVGGGGWFWLPGAAGGYRNNSWYANGFQSAPVVHGPAGWTAPAAPAALAGGAGPSTVRVGTLGNQPAYIPGGRAVPNFRSVVPNSMASRPVPNSFAARPAANPVTKSGPVYAPRSVPPSAMRVNPDAALLPQSHAIHNSGGHVYAAPPRGSAVGFGGADMVGAYSGGSPMGGRGAAMGTAVPSAISGVPAGGRPGGGGSHAPSGAAHGSPK
jgi:hypothetical protein